MEAFLSEYTALGILGGLVIGGFFLFKWVVQKWLPMFLTVLKNCSDDICKALNNLSVDTRRLSERVDTHDKNTDRFDLITKDLLNKQNSVIEILDRQTKVLEKISDHLGDKK